MNLHDIQSLADSGRHELSWDGDNRKFLCRWLIPNLKLSDDDKQIMTWCYGCHDPKAKNWETVSDGETLVHDMFMNGVIKSPAGVCHDYINRVYNHITPDGHKWTPREANALYRRIAKALGYSFRLRWRRWLGITISSEYWWR